MSDTIKVREALSKVGIQINNIYDLVNTTQPYSNAIPVLINLLKQGLSDDRVKEGVIRALAVKEAKGKAGKVLIEEYHKTSKEKSLLRWAIGNTMEMVIDNSDIQEVVDIVKNKENGMSRQMFVIALGKVKSEQAEQALIASLYEDEIAPFALEALANMKSTKAKGIIDKLLYHSKPLIKKEAQKAKKRIG